MKLVITSDENVELVFPNACPRCGEHYNDSDKKQTMNHAIPNFLKPGVEITHSLCLKCHQELNLCYVGQRVLAIKHRFNTDSFAKFHDTYENLRQDFYERKIDRGQFGEGLWSNLVTFLQALDQKVKEEKGLRV